jgi:hypothetical protein
MFCLGFQEGTEEVRRTIDRNHAAVCRFAEGKAMVRATGKERTGCSVLRACESFD